jgi:D-hexose-6-phosphate mutarotase
MSNFGDDEYKRMVCMEAAAIEKQITLSPVRSGLESWNFLTNFLPINHQFCMLNG